jgi:peptide/nickel transport system substrate-binding protein
VFFQPRPGSPQALVARQFDVVQFGWAGGFEPGADLHHASHSGSIPSRRNDYRGGNFAGYRSGRNDVLQEQGLRYVDQAFRQVVYGEAQELWMEDLPVLPLYWRPAVMAASERLVSLRPTMAPRGETWNAEQWDLLP